MIKAIQIRTLAGALACVAKSNLAQSANFLKKMRNFRSLRRVHREFAVLDQSPFLGQRFQIAAQQFLRQWRSNRLARLLRQDGPQRLRQLDLLLSALGQQIRPPAQILGRLMVVLDTRDRIRRDRASDAQCDALPRLLQEFLQEEGHPQGGMNHADQLKSQAVTPAKIYG